MIDLRTAQRSLLAVHLALGAAAGCAPESKNLDEINLEPQAIQAGQLENGYPAVGEVLEGDGTICTGTLVAPMFVLTAAHCSAPTLTFNVGTDSSNFVSYAVDQQIVPADPVTNDMMLLHLVEPITDIAPIDLYTYAYATPAVGTTCVAVGFGDHEESNGVTTHGRKRSATERIEAIDYANINVVLVSGIADHGDSGGPLLCDGRIAGVVHNHSDHDWPEHQRELYTTINARWLAYRFPGGLIVSDTDDGLAMNAYGGAHEGTPLRLVANCSRLNPDCTWTYRDGMILSDADPGLAVNAYGGAHHGTELRLVRECTNDNTDCTWTYTKGMFISDSDPSLAINAVGGAVDGASLKLVNSCSKDNTDCTFTQLNTMILSDTDSRLAMNAYGGARHGAPLVLVDSCTSDNPDCRWTLSKGMVLGSAAPWLAMNAYGGADYGTELKLVNSCGVDNPDCTWTMKRGLLHSDSDGDLAVNAYGGARDGTALTLVEGCDASLSDCRFTSTHNP